jgi:hypothetical protein
MSKEQIIDEVYKNYLNEWTFEKYPNDGSVYSVEPIKVKEHSKEQFVYRCKTDNEFSEKWGLKIEERELSLEERIKQIPYSEKHTIFEERECIDELRTLKNKELQSFQKYIKEQCDKINIPTKLITLEYNQEKIYIYE